MTMSTYKPHELNEAQVRYLIMCIVTEAFRVSKEVYLTPTDDMLEHLHRLLPMWYERAVEERWQTDPTYLPPLNIDDLSATPVEMAKQCYPATWRRSDGTLFRLVTMSEVHPQDYLVLMESIPGKPEQAHWNELVLMKDLLAK